MTTARPDRIRLFADWTAGALDVHAALWPWLPRLGPTASLALQHLAGLARNEPAEVDVIEMATALGVKPYVLHKALDRLVRFRCASWIAGDALTIRMALHPPRTPVEVAHAR